MARFWNKLDRLPLVKLRTVASSINIVYTHRVVIYNHKVRLNLQVALYLTIIITMTLTKAEALGYATRCNF